MTKTYLTILLLCSSLFSFAQSAIHPQHFDLSEVTLLDSHFKKSMDLNIQVLLNYNLERLMTPYVRESGLNADNTSAYYNWTSRYPTFPSWSQFDGHEGGHFVSALAEAYAACKDEDVKSELMKKLNRCITIMNDCQKAYDNNTEGMYGFVSGLEINYLWKELYRGNTSSWGPIAYKVPFYCTHKVLAGLRDAWLYAGNETAKECFRKFSDWHVNIISKLTDSQLQGLLDTEHGGIVETLVDAYTVFGDQKYLDAAKRYSHDRMINGLQTLDLNFLTGYHANTQVPKFTGYERIWNEDSSARKYRAATINFWTDVVENRTVAIGGNSVSEHFLAHDKGDQYIMNVDGPETCNSHNMLRLDETLFDETHESKFVDAYEQTMYNHILPSQDPVTGGYQYFTPLRPQSYRTYSTINKSMWCCVGTGMENHNKYGHFIYTHSLANDTLYVNLFTASKLDNERFALTQTTGYPYEQHSKITIDKAGSYALAVRRPSWTTDAFAIRLNGASATTTMVNGYAVLKADFNAGDVVDVDIPMTLRIEECPDYGEYIAFKYGPVLLAAKTSANSDEEAEETGLDYEKLTGEYGGEGGGDHVPSYMMSQKSLISSPIIVGARDTIINCIRAKDLSKLEFEITPTNLSLAPDLFKKRNYLTMYPYFDIAHARYQFYWYQPSEEEFANSDLVKRDEEQQALNARTIDYVATGEQQSEVMHNHVSASSGTGGYSGELYRDCQPGGFVQYTLFIPENERAAITADSQLALMLRFTFVDTDRTAVVYIDGTRIAAPKVRGEAPKRMDKYGFYNLELPIPSKLLFDNEGKVKSEIIFRFEASLGTMIPGLYYVRLLRDYCGQAYQFRNTDWIWADDARVTRENIIYNDDNTITVNTTGKNNVCLQFDCNNTDFYTFGSNKYLIVEAEGISTATDDDVLWWLNGNCSYMARSSAKKVKLDDGTEIVCVGWYLNGTGLTASCVGDVYSLSQGQTCFGLTPLNGTCKIRNICFAPNFRDYTNTVGISNVRTNNPDAPSYNLLGQQVHSTYPGIRISEGRKTLTPMGVAHR